MLMIFFSTCPVAPPQKKVIVFVFFMALVTMHYNKQGYDTKIVDTGEICFLNNFIK